MKQIKKEKPFIGIIKLKNGEELVSEILDITVDEETDGDLWLIKPMKVHSYFDSESDPPKQILYLNPWFPIGVVKEYDVNLYLDDVFAYVEVSDEFAEHYEQARKDLKEIEDEKEESISRYSKVSENVYSFNSNKKTKPNNDEEKDS